ncbi:MAG TPA: AraC family transcriptional regulator [Phenylobacterium sp.]|nr:AraC family transcriptional regulator [Phenylobacterium sp.]
MADGNLQPRHAEPAIHRLAGRNWPGFEAYLIRTDPGLHRAGPQALDRVGFHVGAPVRADCACDGVRLSGWQSRCDFDLVPAGASGAWEDETAADILGFRFQTQMLHDAAEGLGLPAERARLQPRLRARDPYVELIAWALKAEVETDTPAPDLYGECLGQALAARLLGRHAGRPPRACGLTPRQLGQVVDLVEAQIDRELSLAELAAAAGVSVSHFTAMFRRAMGQSAHRYVVERRVLRAQALLARNRLPIADVAAATGFSHPSHLARWMRRVSGLTPSAFARAH